MNHDLPLVSIITVCLNAEKTIARTLESVRKQTYEHIEYIVIDGMSNDNTIKILADYADTINVLISEKDEGISSAFNKGISAASGEFVQLLNADDYLPEDKIEKSVQALIQNKDAAFVFGDMITTDAQGAARLHITGDPDYGRCLGYLDRRLNHPTYLVRRSVYDNFGGFNPRWKIAMDYDWILRIHRAGERGVYSPEIVVYMQEGGVSHDWRRAMLEIRNIRIANGTHRLIADLAYCIAILKIRMRIMLEKFLPETIIALFRPGKAACRGYGHGRNLLTVDENKRG